MQGSASVSFVGPHVLDPMSSRAELLIGLLHAAAILASLVLEIPGRKQIALPHLLFAVEPYTPQQVQGNTDGSLFC